MTDITIDILCHADFSGRLRRSVDDAGMPVFAGRLRQARQANPEGTILLDAGDGFCTNFWGGRPTVEALNMIGTDAMTLGNHEFDRGEAFLDDCVAACRFDVLCANIRHKADGTPVSGTRPYVIIQRQGVRIGILGLTTEYTPYMVEKTAMEPFETISAAAAANEYIPQMRAQGAEAIVALTHMPFYFDGQGRISGELADLLAAIPPVEVAIGGHIPGDYAQTVGTTCVIKAGFGGRSLGHARLVFDQDHHLVDRGCDVSLTDRDGAADPDMAAYIATVVGPFESYFSQPLSRADERWAVRLAVECKVGDFLADALRYGGRTEVAYMNATSSGGAIEPGAVTRETITRVNGFNDLICTGVMTGQQLYELMEAVYQPERFGNNAALFISGFHAVLDHTRPYPHKVVALTLADGTPIDRRRTYTVATSAYMASGGNGTEALAGQVAWHKSQLHFYDAAFAYAQTMEVLTVADYPRLAETGHPENDNAPF